MFVVVVGVRIGVRGRGRVKDLDITLEVLKKPHNN